MFKVSKQFARGPESIVQTFKTYQEAETFIQAQLLQDKHYNVQSTYRIYEFDEVMKEFTQADVKIENEDTSSTRSGKGQTFSPTPFNTKPQPRGLPHTWIKDEPEDDEDKK